MYCADSAAAFAIAWLTSAGTRLEKRSARRASAHCRRDQDSPLLQPLGERRDREVQEHREREPVLEGVLDEVRARIVAGEDLVEGVDRPEIEVRLPPEVAADLVHVAVEGLERELHPGEEGVAGRGVAGELLARHRLERRGVAVLGAPELGRLREPLVDARALAIPRTFRRARSRAS